MAKHFHPDDITTITNLTRTHCDYNTDTGHLAVKPETPRNILSRSAGHCITFHTLNPARTIPKHRLLYLMHHNIMPNYVIRKDGNLTNDRADNLIGTHDPAGRQPVKPN